MKYFKNKDTNQVFAYDETYDNDQPYIQQAIDNGWEDISDKWPPKETATNEQLAAKIKDQRNLLLNETDWVVARAFEQQQDIPSEWKDYRQALRDITLQPNFPTQINWPDKPQ